MDAEAIVRFAANSATWGIYCFGIVGFIFASMKFRFSKETWKEFFRFYFGIGAFLLGLAVGFQGISEALGTQFHLSYSIKSIITAIFMILYIYILYKSVKGLFEKEGFEWMGAVWLLFVIGCVLNAIFTGGRYIPVVGWFVNG